MMMTTTNTTNTTNTAQQRTKRSSPEEEERLRDRWENRVVGALFRKLKREVRAANALLWTPGWVEPDLVSMWFMPQHAADVTRHAALAEECRRASSSARSRPPTARSGAPRWPPRAVVMTMTTTTAAMMIMRKTPTLIPTPRWARWRSLRPRAAGSSTTTIWRCALRGCCGELAPRLAHWL